MAEQIITNKDRLKFYNEKEYHYKWDRKLKDMSWKYTFFYPIVKAVCRFKFGDFEYHGTENLPKTGPVMICSNHVAGLDPIALTGILYRDHNMRNLYFMAKEEFFHTFYTKIPLLVLGGFPVKRGTADRDALEFSIRILNEGNCLLVFPEGTRDKTRSRPKVENAKAGMALIARETKADIVPMSVYRGPTVKGQKDKYVIRLGEVIPFEELGLGEKPKSRELKETTNLVMERIIELWDKDGQQK